MKIFTNETSPAPSRVGWTAQPDGRGTINIIWSCLFTLFLCVWTVLSLNVPGEKTSAWIYTRRKLKWMLVAAIGPEWMTASAGAQWSIARRSANKMRASGYEWSLAHSFFADMGGLRLKLQDDEFPITAGHLYELLQKNLVDFPDITAEMIADRSKADVIAKLVTILQTAWFVLQCIARTVQRLPLTSLELSTIAFVVCTLASNIFWWSKPKDVFIPVVFSSKVKLRLEDLIGPDRAKNWKSSPLEKYDDLRPNLMADVYPQLPFTKGSLESQEAQKVRFRNDRLPPAQRDWWLTVFLTIVSIVFGVVYVLGWKIEFPTATELLIWRISTVGMLSAVSSFWLLDFGMEAYHAALRTEMEPITAYRIALCVVIMLVYVTCRCYLIVEAFVSLRSLPVRAYTTVNWSQIIPHL